MTATWPAIAIINNQEYSAVNKTVALALSAPNGNLALLGTPNTALLTIVNDDPDPPSAIIFSPANYTISESGGTAIITVSRTGGSSNKAIGVSYTMREGTAHRDQDYIFSSGALQWEANDLADKTISAPIIDNDYYYPMSKYLHITLSTPTNGAVLGNDGTYQSILWATLTIIDDDLPATIAFSSATYTANEEAGTATITVKRLGKQSASSVVTYALMADPGTAQASSSPMAGVDYKFVSDTPPYGWLQWEAGETAGKSFAVTIYDDALVEGDETVNLELLLPGPPPAGTGLGSPSTTTLTILDDE